MRMPRYEPWSAERAQMIIAANKHREGAALPILHALQHAFGCIPEAAIPMVAEALNLSRAEIYGTVTFYHDFRDTPPGRRVLKLCNHARPQAAMLWRRAPRRSSA
jgi:formate dehydrogenase subunit gamma